MHIPNKLQHLHVRTQRLVLQVLHLRHRFFPIHFKAVGRGPVCFRQHWVFQPPIGAEEYTKQDLPFFVVDEQVDKRVGGGDFDRVKGMDADQDVVSEPDLDSSKPVICGKCGMTTFSKSCDSNRPCDHQFCSICIRKLEISKSSTEWRCPRCSTRVSQVAGFAAPMNLPGEEALRVKVPVHVLKVEDGRPEFRSIQRMRI